ncbi:unnamed protein product [Closterium sp. NIES-64]|nr:unnamed protein product [Closterium sp. NIES-64]
MASPRSCRACAGPYSLLPALVLLVTYNFASPHQPRATAFSLRVVSPFRSRTHEEDERSAPPAIARRKLASSLPCTNSSLFGYAYAVQLGDGYARRVVVSLPYTAIPRRRCVPRSLIPLTPLTPRRNVAPPLSAFLHFITCQLLPLTPPSPFFPLPPPPPPPPPPPSSPTPPPPSPFVFPRSSSVPTLSYTPHPPVSFCTGSRSFIWKTQVGLATEIAPQAVALSGAQEGWIAVGWSGDDGRMGLTSQRIPPPFSPFFPLFTPFSPLFPLFPPSASLILHWKPQVGMVTDMALQAVALSGAQKGWISVGWSGDGRMSRSDAVVGNVDNYPSNVVALYLAGRSFADVKPAGYDLGRTVLEQGTTGSFVIKFSRRVDDGTVRFDPTGANTLIWAYSADPGSSQLGFHGGNKGSALVDFSCTGKAASPLIQRGTRLAAVLAVVLAVLCLAL